MDSNVQSIVRDCTTGSDDGRMTFPEVVMRLLQAGVESYHADLRRAEKTYYLPNGDSLVVPSDAVAGDPAPTFGEAGVAAAIKAIQAGGMSYRQFCEAIVAAGCVGYLVSLAGRRAVYFGRTGDFHVEHFPTAK